MDNAGSISGGTATNGYFLDPNGKYIDWWNTIASNSTNAFTWSRHNILFLNDPGIHTYFTLDHSATDIAGSVGQVQWVFRGNLNQFVNTYSVNIRPRQSRSHDGSHADCSPLRNRSRRSGTNVQDATSDLHGQQLPQGFRREFYTKYDYSSYEYLHRAEGVYGPISLHGWSCPVRSLSPAAPQSRTSSSPAIS